MKKIVIIAQGISNGGAERVASILANYLCNNDFIVDYISVYQSERKKDDYFISENVNMHFINVETCNHAKRLIMRNFQVLNKVKKIKPECIISFINFDTFLTTYCTGIPIIFSLRNDPAHIKYSIFKKILFELEYLKACKIIFQSKGAQNQFKKSIIQKSYVISNPIITKDLPRWNGSDSKTFITACRFNEQKNLKMLIKAFKKVNDKYPEYNLELYGDGEQKEELNELIKKLNSEKYIKLKGFSLDIHNIMAKSYGFILSSNYEGLPNAMLEALCIGLPCICTDCPPGGPREYINHKKNGLLVNVNDEEDMFKNICFLIENSAIRNLFSSFAEQYRKQLEVNTICNEWKNVLKDTEEKCINKRRKYEN